MPEFAARRQDFLSLYPSRAQHIYKTPNDKNWKVSRFRLASGLIDAAISTESDFFYGAFWGSETAFAVLDIDKNSKYHNVQELQELRRKLTIVGLSETCLYQSSNSKGWHLYLPFSGFVQSKPLERTLKAWLKLIGYEITCGQLEVFPSGNGLRLPLQRGFAWLDSKGEVLIRREQIPLGDALSRFLKDIRENANNWETVKTRIESELEAAADFAVAGAGGIAGNHENAVSTEGFDSLFAHRVIQRNYNLGRQYWHEGLKEKNQRHDAIMCVEHYLWHGDPVAGLPALPGRFNDKTRFRLLRTWLEEKHNGYSWLVTAGNWHAVEADIERACTWRGDNSAHEHEPYPCTERAQDVLIAKTKQTGRVWTMDDLKKGNDRRERSARSKIRRVVRQLQAAGQQLTRNGIAKKSGCSPNTVSKHQDLWKPLTSGSGDQSRGVSGGSRPSETRLVLLEVEKQDINILPSEQGFSTSGNTNSAFSDFVETTKTQALAAIAAKRKTHFILPYGSQRRPGSDSLPVRRQISADSGLAAAAAGIKIGQRHDCLRAYQNVELRTSQPHQILVEGLVYRLVFDAGGEP